MATKRRKSQARFSNQKRKSTKSNFKNNWMKQLKMAKRAEKVAVAKMGSLVRQHQSTIEKMRKQVKLTIAQKLRQATKARQQIVKKYLAMIKKLRKEHQLALKKAKNVASKVGSKSRRTRRYKAKSQTSHARKMTRPAKHRGFSANRSASRRKSSMRRAA